MSCNCWRYFGDIVSQPTSKKFPVCNIHANISYFPGQRIPYIMSIWPAVGKSITYHSLLVARSLTDSQQHALLVSDPWYPPLALMQRGGDGASGNFFGLLHRFLSLCFFSCQRLWPIRFYFGEQDDCEASVVTRIWCRNQRFMIQRLHQKCYSTMH
jgi:hypothetical protein